jgi:hypothetical protein
LNVVIPVVKDSGWLAAFLFSSATAQAGILPSAPDGSNPEILLERSGTLEFSAKVLTGARRFKKKGRKPKKGYLFRDAKGLSLGHEKSGNSKGSRARKGMEESGPEFIFGKFLARN